jgi:hypothetical protein
MDYSFDDVPAHGAVSSLKSLRDIDLPISCRFERASAVEAAFSREACAM